MNRITNEHFSSKRYDEAIKVKKSLEKLLGVLDMMTNNTDKLTYMMKYKAAKGI